MFWLSIMACMALCARHAFDGRTLPQYASEKTVGQHVRGGAQMGGAKGVQAAEQYTLVTGLRDGMWVIAEPR